MQNDPLVSVIMATFNEPKRFIEESISSILNQTYSKLELLIADDSTKEETIKVIDDFAANDDRVRVIRKETRMGFVNALNIALKEAKGDFIARMDGDDISFPDRIRKEVDYLTNHKDAAMVYSSYISIDEMGQIISRSFPPINYFFLKHQLNCGNNPVVHPAVMVNLNVSGPIRYDNVCAAEDYLLWLKIAQKGKIGVINKPLVKYRILQDSLSRRIDNQNFYYFILMLLVNKFSLQTTITDKESQIFSNIYKHLKEISNTTTISNATIKKQHVFYVKYKKYLGFLPETCSAFLVSTLLSVKNHFFLKTWSQQIEKSVN